MREVLDRTELHRLFMDELHRHPGAQDSRFTFEIDFKPEGPGGCNWYPLASIELWQGDLMANLAVFREVRERLAGRYNIVPPEVENGVEIAVVGSSGTA
ncbi:hypothetical protein [Longimicrobium terrae]|uniref:Uncharacterized protein n=1 Tax=Longimicrobium terrae TaxID=1639882 RepID=A0A841H842_9BACT|nr:hypothetical protein [Longimicrobium terrae]MBB4639487.1 hypothetical protein [Longimicrobium terrae]MBB6073859.1 hypothetical protein [Longimicrobium terrae]NNC32535.1 hypothetical protein [Longimicrobium terrae]